MLRRAVVFAAAFTVLAAFGSAAVAAGGACLPKAEKPSEGSGLSVAIRDCAFGPTILHAPTGATITWTNEDYLPHAVAGAGWSANTEPFGKFDPGTSVSRTFAAPGIYAYMCHLHPGMTGIVIVGDVAFPAPPPGPIVPSQGLANPAPSAGTPAGLPVAFAMGGLVLGLLVARWPRRWRVSGRALRAALTDRRDPHLGDWELIDLPVGDDVDAGTDRTGQHHHAVPGSPAHP